MDRKDDQQLRSLAAHIRERGVAPRRDLWPDIDAAIERLETAPGGRPVAAARRAGGRGLGRAGLLAACLAAVIGLCVFLAPRPRTVGSPAAAGSAAGGLALVDGALAELRDAMSENPDDPHLAHLLRTLQMSRCELMVKDAESRRRAG